ncbi:MAG: ribonuclease D [Mycobacterium sp.]|nr:ribonuclease D [Mycobacterium sp.]
MTDDTDVRFGAAAPQDQVTESVPDAEPIPLHRPADGVPPVSVTAEDIARAADKLAAGTGAFAVDAERASGFRYSNRAYLIQIRRHGAGTVLIDPVNHGGSPIDVLAPLSDVLGSEEWILHAADQDLPCLAEVGLRPPALYDTELAGRLAGFDRVNLAAMVQRLLGLSLAKGHGAADWSTRPLPPDWLNYAALDVEVLLELRDAVADVLDQQHKTSWAAEEFEFLRCSEATPTRRDRWRKTSGIHKVRTQQGLAAVRELWTARDRIARSRDIAPGRILPDSAIIAAALAQPTTVAEITALPVFGGSRQKRSAQVWLDALRGARNTPDPPDLHEPVDGPPPTMRWARRNPEAAARLDAARTALSRLSAEIGVPTENLIAPDLVRRLCWDWQSPADPSAAVADFLRGGGARDWQRHLVGPVLSTALSSQASPEQA